MSERASECLSVCDEGLGAPFSPFPHPWQSTQGTHIIAFSILTGSCSLFSHVCFRPFVTLPLPVCAGTSTPSPSWTSPLPFSTCETRRAFGRLSTARSSPPPSSPPSHSSGSRGRCECTYPSLLQESMHASACRLSVEGSLL